MLDLFEMFELWLREICLLAMPCLLTCYLLPCHAFCDRLLFMLIYLFIYSFLSEKGFCLQRKVMCE